MAVTSLPSRSPSSRTASTVIDATSGVPLQSRWTMAVAGPSVMPVTVPGSLLRALSFMARRLPSSPVTEAFWDEQAAAFDTEPDHGLRDPVVRAAWAALLHELLPPAPAAVVDLGCGTGS